LGEHKLVDENEWYEVKVDAYAYGYINGWVMDG
jgi:hypothetical protein